MRENTVTGEVNTETRKELQEKYFPELPIYANSNMGIISLLSDVQHHIHPSFHCSCQDEHYRVVLNDIKCVLSNEDRKQRESKKRGKK